MMDLISRQAAIDVLDKNHILGRGDLNEVLDHIVDRLEKLPSAQPEPCEDAVSRDSVSKWLDRWEGYIDKDMINRMQYKVCDIPSVKPDIPTVDTPTVVPTCEDTISRQDAIRVASGYCHPANIAKELAKLPSAQPERESIKWIPHESIFGGSDERVYTCDKCGYNIGFHVENFCPNCGGK